MDIGLMVEGQNGLTWERWSHILQMAERLGFPTVFRSDHYFIGPQQNSLEAYLSFVMAASQTKTIRFGPLVSPVTFRSPVDLGRMAAQIDVLSGGRFVMGMGAGWNEAEHKAYGIYFPSLKERMDRLEEAIHVVKAVWSENPANYAGKYYQVEGVNCLPRPASGRPPLLIGGNGEKRTLKMVAQHASEWNSTGGGGPDGYAHKVDVLAEHCAKAGRDPKTIRRSMMTFGVVGPNEQALDKATERVMGMWGAPAGSKPAEYREVLKRRGMIVGSTDEVVQTLGKYGELGLNEIDFQHFNFDSDEIPEYLAGEIAPRVKKL